MTALRGITMPPAGTGLWRAIRRRLERAIRGGPEARPMERRWAPPCPGVGSHDDPVWQTAAAVMAHDLRAPAAAIVALAGLRRMGTVPADVFADHVVRQARQALALTDELVALLREPLHAYRLAPVDLREMLSNGIDACWRPERDAMHDAIASPRLAVEPCEAWVMADARMLGEVVGLMLNRVCMGCGGRDGVEVRLTLADAGYHLTIRASCGDEAVAAALSAAAPAGLLVRRVLHRHGGALLDGAGLQADGALEWRLALPAWARRAPNKKAPEGAFLQSVA
jgi:hypothetical protein